MSFYTWCLLGLLGWAIFLGALRRPPRPSVIEYPRDGALVFSENN